MEYELYNIIMHLNTYDFFGDMMVQIRNIFITNIQLFIYLLLYNGHKAILYFTYI